MKARSTKDLKTELNNYSKESLVNICLQMAKYKKDNKELLNYILFESENEDKYINDVKKDIDDSFSVINKQSIYIIKKSLRKILKNTKQAIRYSNNKSTEVELLCYFCKKMRTEKIPMQSSLILRNIYATQLRLAESALSKLHEDFKIDFQDIIAFLKS